MFHADVVCIEAAVLPDGEGDTFAASLSPAAPEDIPREPTPGIDPIAHGNISIMVDRRTHSCGLRVRRGGSGGRVE